MANKARSMRKVYGENLIRLGRENDQIVAVSADVANSDHSLMFGEQFPDRFYNVGIAEQSLVDIGVGLAHSGKIPFVNTFAFLFATRALEMVRTHLCYGNGNVKLMGAYAGLSDSFDGPTHHSITDLAIMRALPRMTIVSPADPASLPSLLEAVAEYHGPVYMRLCRNEIADVHEDGVRHTLGRAAIVQDGTDVTIVSTGVMLNRVMTVTKKLEKAGVSTRVVDMHTLKPLDTDAIYESAEKTRGIVTVEEHTIIGGLGGAVAESIAERGMATPVRRVGIRDSFAETGPYEEILDKHGLSIEEIEGAAMGILG